MTNAIRSDKPVVLAVDDAHQYLNMLGAMLQPLYNVRLASSGRRALQLAVMEPLPDLVILDVLMPEMDGHAVMAALRANPLTREVPVIFMTSLQEITDEVAGLAEGAADYIVKPALPDVLRARVRTQIELKRLRDEMRRRNAELQEEIARREVFEQSLGRSLADMEAFSYSVSHDLRTPIATISGFATSLLETEAARLSGTGVHRLERIVTGARKMGSMIDDILAYSRTNHEPMKAVSVDLGTLVDEVVDEARPAGAAAAVRIGPMPHVWADRAMLRQVLANLVGNAFKFSAGRPDALVEIAADVGGAGCEIRVRDNGVGFDPEYADKLFRLFQRLHNEDEFAGSGVGLAIVQRLVRRHGGEVAAESIAGGWTTFKFTLPHDPAQAAQAAQEEATKPVPVVACD